MIDFNLFVFEYGKIYRLDTRNFRISVLPEYPERLYILDSKPINKTDLSNFLNIIRVSNIIYIDRSITNGIWDLKYIHIIPTKESYYILNRYLKKINWEETIKE